MTDFMSIIKYSLKLTFSLIHEYLFVFKGFMNYSKLRTKNVSKTFLTRNTHRLEKGLIMQFIRKNFGKSYIIETIQTHKKLLSKNENIEYESSVLKYYIDNYVDDIEIKNHTKYLEDVLINNNKIPFKRLAINQKIKIEEFYKLSEYRRSTRWFLNEKVSVKKLEKAFECALQSPSACNRQPFRYIVINNKELINKIGNLPGGMRGYVENINCLIVCVGDLSVFEKPTDRHLIYIDSSLSNMALIYGLELQGISSCCINWQDVRKNNLVAGKILKLKSFEKITMMMAVGYPDLEKKVPFSQKKSTNTMVEILD